MARRLLAVLAAVCAVSVVGISSAVAAPSPIALVIPQGTAFGFLGHSCGGIQEQTFATGFDVATGFPDGVSFLSTRCGGSGRGGGYTSTTYSAWVSASWDFTGALLSVSQLSASPTVDPTLVAYDVNGNELYNQSNSAFLLWSPTFVPVPRVTGLSSASGSVGGGAALTISGTGFTNATAVSFGPSAATSFTVNSDTSITAVTPPASPGTVDVTVTSAGGTSVAGSADQFTFVPVPVVLSVSPNSGPVTGGTSVTIAGTGFTGASLVSFGGTPAGFTVNADSSITATTPVADAADVVDVTVTTLGGTSAISATDQFAYTTVVTPFTPTITKISPNYGPPAGGTAVTITGTNFTGVTEVVFGGNPASSYTVVSGTSVTAVAPPGSDTVDVTVTSPNGTSPTTLADEFSYGPRVTQIAPVMGSAGGNTKVTIYGHNFLGATDVSFGTESALSFTVNLTGTAIVAVTPPEAVAGVESVDVTVSGPDGTSPIVPKDVFSYVAPVVTKLAPTSGSAGGNTKVTIYGHYFYGATDVSFGGIPAASYTVNATGSAIVAITPPEAVTGVETVDVSVTTSAGTGTLAGAFTYQVPTVTKIAPISGSGGGGTTVTIYGLYLYGATAADFGTAPATITKMSSTTLVVITPPGSGTVDVSVTTTAGTGTLAAAFTYLAPAITGISPTTGPPTGGTKVTLYGTSFKGATAVNFGATPATTFTIISNTTIVAYSPPGTGTVDITVTNPAGTSPTTAIDHFTY